MADTGDNLPALADEIELKVNPAEIEINYDHLKSRAEEILESYRDIVVTQDSVKGAKEMARDLNKMAQEIDRIRKDTKAEVSKPVEYFDQCMKELHSLFSEARQEIKTQIDAFEQQYRDECARLLDEYRERLWNEKDIRADHRRATYDDLIKTSAVTASGSLAKGPRQSLEMRVAEDASRQELVDQRIAGLEGASYKAGLTMPVTPEHLGNALEADRQDFEHALENVIQRELAREQKAAEDAREAEQRKAKLEDDKAAQGDEQGGDDATPAAPTASNDSPRNAEAEDARPAPPPGFSNWTLEATFHLVVPNTASAETIEKQFRQMLEQKAGVKTLAHIVLDCTAVTAGETEQQSA